MHMHNIEIDDEVMSYLKQHAEPFIETAPNAVLRRLLFGARPGRPAPVGTHAAGAGASNGQRPHIPAGTPQALRQILEVVHLVRHAALSRSAATHRVAQEHHVAPQTVQDKYCRQLGLTATEFDKLLLGHGTAELKAGLFEKFPAHKEIIREALK